MKKLFALFVLASLAGSSAAFAQQDSTGYAPISKPYQERKPWTERIVIGGSFGLGFGTFTNVNLSPIIGYKVTDDLILGAGPTYIYTSTNFNGIKYKYSVYGGRLYGRQRVFDNFYVQAEYEMLNVQDYQGGDPNSRRWIQAPLIGGTYVQPIGERSAFVISVLFNLNYQPTLSPYANPIIRVGFNL